MKRCRTVGLVKLEEGALVVRTFRTTEGCTEADDLGEVGTELADILLLSVGVLGSEDMVLVFCVNLCDG